MTTDWVRTAAARRILVHWMDARPAWLWSGDGDRLIWCNPAAPMFGAKQKKSGLRLVPDRAPIKGQIARLLRLGSMGRSSLSRLQFLAGDRPESATCTVTPLQLADDAVALLVVGVDPIEPALLEQMPGSGLADALLPEGAAYLLIGPDGGVAGGSTVAMEHYEALFSDGRLPMPEDSAQLEIDGETLALTRFKAGPAGEHLLLIEGSRHARDIADVRAEEGLNAGDDEPDSLESDEPSLPFGIEPRSPRPAAPEEEAEDAYATGERRSLASLFDRLADAEGLYGDAPASDEDTAESNEDTAESDEDVRADEPELAAEVTADEEPSDEQPSGEVASEEASEEPSDEEGSEEAASASVRDAPVSGEPDVIAALIEYEDDLADDSARTATYRVTGRGVSATEAEPGSAAGEDDIAFEEAAAAVAPGEPLAPDVIEQASRYNFGELSRILTDRVAGAGDETLPAGPAPAGPPPPEGALVSIAGETFILNRLPIGILVFRDQHVLFANRAMTDLVGYATVDGLRAAGMAAIFPSDDASAGPVTHLLRRDGESIPVTARLQSISWQGRPALMLSASAAEMRIGHEAAVRSFAQLLSGVVEEGFFEADRAGMIRSINTAASSAQGRAAGDLAGTPLAALVHADEVPALRAFLEKPARFAETTRPSVALRGAAGGTQIIVFAEGQAGIVSGYFGFVRKPAPDRAAPGAPADDADPSMLARISRGVRRPLNTIIGFADLIRSASFATVEDHRYVEYARDIKTAGHEIAVLVDELDEFARLKTGRYAPRPAEIDLSALLESCVVRVRGQASAARVLVRSGISERLPHIRADRPSFGQAILNLLASAIDQSPTGGSVILSAQLEDDGGVVVNIRDSSAAGTDLGERFVVFRDGVGKDGETLAPVRSSVGLALTRSLVAVNGCRLSVDPAGATGTLFSLTIPTDLIARQQAM